MHHSVTLLQLAPLTPNQLEELLNQNGNDGRVLESASIFPGKIVNKKLRPLDPGETGLVLLAVYRDE